MAGPHADASKLCSGGTLNRSFMKRERSSQVGFRGHGLASSESKVCQPTWASKSLCRRGARVAGSFSHRSLRQDVSRFPIPRVCFKHGPEMRRSTVKTYPPACYPRCCLHSTIHETLDLPAQSPLLSKKRISRKDPPIGEGRQRPASS